MPLQRRLPKGGFTNPFKKQYVIINLKDLERFAPDSELDPAALKEAGLVDRVRDGIALLGDGAISHPLTVKVHRASKKAKEKVEAAGGKVEIL